MEQIWVVHTRTWAMQLMWQVDAKEAIRLGDYGVPGVNSSKCTVRRKWLYDRHLEMLKNAANLPYSD